MEPWTSWLPSGGLNHEYLTEVKIKVTSYNPEEPGGPPKGVDWHKCPSRGHPSNGGPGRAIEGENQETANRANEGNAKQGKKTRGQQALRLEKKETHSSPWGQRGRGGGGPPEGGSRESHAGRSHSSSLSGSRAHL
jgi:hypothetical protein